MASFHITKGKDIKIKGSANKEIVDIPLAKNVAIQPPDFKGLKPRLQVKVDDTVKVGTPLVTDKTIESITIVSPAAGKVVAINRGNKRALLEVVVETSDNQEAVVLESYGKDKIGSLSADDIKAALLKGGLWPSIRQRPFNILANPADAPKSIFIRAFSTDPLAIDYDTALASNEEDLQVGVNALRQLTDGSVHLCKKQGSALNVDGAEIHEFDGPHPAGNVSTFIHNVDPINKGDIVWYLDAQDVVRVGQLLLNGAYPNQRVVAITGEGAKNKVYAKTNVGTPLSALLQGSDLEKMRCITGSILSGRDVGANGYLGFYDSQITVIPEGGTRELLGWLMPGFKKYTFTRTYASAFVPSGDVSLDTDTNGGDRAIVLNHIYDELVPLDIMTYFLLKAIIAGDIEESEKLGILECDPEDFALCTFACPSKTDVGNIIREGLEIIRIEG